MSVNLNSSSESTQALAANPMLNHIWNRDPLNFFKGGLPQILLGPLILRPKFVYHRVINAKFPKDFAYIRTKWMTLNDMFRSSSLVLY